MARRIETEITGDSSRFVSAAEDAGASSTDLMSTWDRLQQSVDDLGESMDTLSEKIEPSGAAMEAADAFGNMERVLIGVNDNLGVMAEQFGISLGPMQEWVAAGANVAGGMEGIIGGGAELVAQFRNIAPGLAPAIAATWAHVTALTAQAVAMIAANWPILAIIAAVALLAGGIILLVQHWDTITQKIPILGEAVDAVVGVVTGATTALTGAFQAVLDFVSNNWREIAPLIALPFAPLILLATDGFGVRTALINFATAVPREVGEAIGDVTSTLSEKGRALIQGMLDGMGEVFLKVWNYTVAIPGEIVSAIGDVATLLWNVGAALVQGLFDGIVATFDAGIDNVKSKLDPRNWDYPGRSPFLDAMEHTGLDAGRLFMAGIARGIEENSDAVRGTYGRTLEALGANGLPTAGGLPLRDDNPYAGMSTTPNLETGYMLGSDGKWYLNEAAMPKGVTGASTTPSGYIPSYVGADQTRALATAPKVGDTFNGMVWTGSYWSQAGARMLAPGEYTGYLPAAPQVIRLELDGQVLAEVVNQHNGRAY